MAHTLVVNLLHCVFSTKNREHLIRDPEKLWSYLRGVARNIGVNTLSVGGTSNHVHLLLAVPPTQAVSKVMRDLKANSSRHAREAAPFAWQDGYAAISVSPSMISRVSDYIASQEEHHRRVPFEVEYQALVAKSGFSYYPKYLLG
jgi:REP element-mobilizing transposase RayT